MKQFSLYIRSAWNSFIIIPSAKYKHERGETKLLDGRAIMLKQMNRQRVRVGKLRGHLAFFLCNQTYINSSFPELNLSNCWKKKCLMIVTLIVYSVNANSFCADWKAVSWSQSTAVSRQGGLDENQMFI